MWWNTNSPFCSAAAWNADTRRGALVGVRFESATVGRSDAVTATPCLVGVAPGQQSKPTSPPPCGLSRFRRLVHQNPGFGGRTPAGNPSQRSSSVGQSRCFIRTRSAVQVRPAQPRSGADPSTQAISKPDRAPNPIPRVAGACPVARNGPHFPRCASIGQAGATASGATSRARRRPVISPIPS